MNTLVEARSLSQEIVTCVKRALEEDIGAGDATTNAIVARPARAAARIVAKQPGVVAGLDVAHTVFTLLDEEFSFESRAEEGATVGPGQVLAEVSGLARALLTGERTALNFLGRMSGIATLTRRFVDAVDGTGAVILDTRKTAPGLRALDKLAVRRGGGTNHRLRLDDMILIKDNHIDQAGSLTEAVRRVWQSAPGAEIEVEARTIEEVRQALGLGVQRILLDNLSLSEMREAVALNRGRARFEASGNVSLENVRAIAETGVDFISVGALTHSPRAFDISLLMNGLEKSQTKGNHGRQ